MSAIVVARGVQSIDVRETLAERFVTHGVPAHLRSDHGPECTAALIRLWLEALQGQTLCIEPGSPWGERVRRILHRHVAGCTPRPGDLLHGDSSPDLDRTMATGVTRLAGMFGDRPGRNEHVSNAVLGRV